MSRPTSRAPLFSVSATGGCTTTATTAQYVESAGRIDSNADNPESSNTGRAHGFEEEPLLATEGTDWTSHLGRPRGGAGHFMEGSVGACDKQDETALAAVIVQSHLNLCERAVV